MNGRGDVRRLKALIKALLPGLVDGAAPDASVSIIDVISLVDQMVSEGRSPHTEISLRDLLAARQVLNKAINGVLQGKAKLQYATRLAEWIIRASTEREDSHVSIISTNYDAAVERALFAQLIRHGVSIGKTVDLGMPWRDAFRDRLHVRPLEARLAILKFHGSLNWLRCEQCGHVTVNVIERIASLDHWEERSPAGFNVCSCQGLLRSILVTPSVVRDVRDANLLGIWRSALENLRLADEWIFVGYSMPTEDIAIRSVLLRAWHARRRRGLQVRVVQFEDEQAAAPTETYKRYHLFFPESALRPRSYRRDGFLSFVDELELLPERQIHSRIRRFFGGLAPAAFERGERERRKRQAESHA